MVIRGEETRFRYDTRQLIARLCPCPLRAASLNDADLLDAVALIVEQRHEPIDIASLAETLAISRRTLERHFRGQLGISVCHAITLVRLEVAKHLLAQTDLSMTAVSIEAGFSSPTRMDNVFRRELGCSPRQLRQQSLAGTASAPVPHTTRPAIEPSEESILTTIVNIHPAADGAAPNFLHAFKTPLVIESGSSNLSACLDTNFGYAVMSSPVAAMGEAGPQVVASGEVRSPARRPR